MKQKELVTRCGIIRYWLSEDWSPKKKTILFLPGLTADHRLFEKQIEYFDGKYNVLTWDAPAHNESRPFGWDFNLMDKATWLDEILEEEGIVKPILVGQSMGGYVGQAYMQKYPGKLGGFVSIDSAPLQRHYMKNWEIAALKKTEPMYRWYPWKRLIKDGAWGTAETKYGRNLMQEMMRSYEHEYYAKLAGHGYRMLAEAIEADLPYIIDCPALLICGEKDKAGSAKRYNVKWAAETGLPIKWIAGAGHNSNTDKPDEINKIIEEFVVGL